MGTDGPGNGGVTGVLFLPDRAMATMILIGQMMQMKSASSMTRMLIHIAHQPGKMKNVRHPTGPMVNGGTQNFTPPSCGHRPA
jgi:hypothetical protein